MTSYSKTSSVPYASVPSHPDPVPQNVIVLTHYHPPPNPSLLFLRRCIFFTFAILLLSAAVFFFYPSDPTLQITRIRLNHVRVNSSPTLTIDLSFSLILRVRNRDFFSLDYNSLDVSVGYRGRELGLVSSHGGKLRARGSSYVNASLDLDGLEIINDVFFLIEDLARGVIPFDTDTNVNGELGLFFFKIPIEAIVSCEVLVNINNQTIVQQDCYPE
ncbi:uncharacterized protein LOC110602933 [Manihot esculenta]|uniref:Late embryogenesis abundant protein LEA-2 subgroup domain-containing protein n=1 Tax=Manihot esculenta TaxID=3983 RepID=A0A2C9UCS4_MANES|nr:uncharacterized protein LOC110602933 [Manihot esculenta]OAY27323.1 hypothetical protein MANES_16G116700v8 [Manihot esculenta]